MAADALTPALSALADPTRRAIVARLARGDATVTQLTAPLSISMPAVSRHLKVLEQAGLVERRRDAQFRPCRLRPEGLAVVATWLEEIRSTWESRLDRLEAYRVELQAVEPEGDLPPEPDEVHRDD